MLVILVESSAFKLCIKNEYHEEGKLPRTWNQSQMYKLKYVLCHVEMICGLDDNLW